MKCPNCQNQLVESNEKYDYENDLYFKEYYCFDCHSLYVCFSQSGDMVDAYLDEVEV